MLNLYKWLTSILFVFVLVSSSLSQSKELIGQIPAFASVHTEIMKLSKDQVLSAEIDGPQNLLVDILIYSAKDKELVAKSDDEAVEPFSWTVFEDGDYYAIFNNVSDESGSYKIRVSSPKVKGEANNRGPANAAVLEIFYTTDRVHSADDQKGARYGSELSGGLEFGRCSISIPKSHTMGELEGPNILRLEFREDQAKHVVLLKTQTYTQTTFFKELSSRVDQSNKKEVLVFVHGFNTDFETAARRTAQLAYDLALKGPAVLYSWPSQDRINIVDYNRDLRNSELSTPHFREFITQLASHTGATTINVIAHSMGNRVLVHGLALTPNSTPVQPTPHIRQIALLAPDIDAAEFRQLATALRSTAEHITLYASSKDGALQASARLAGYTRAGEGGPNLVVVPGIDTIDASAVDTSLLGLWHSYYADNQSILSDLFYLFRGVPANERVRLRSYASPQGTYWNFVPAAR